MKDDKSTYLPPVRVTAQKKEVVSPLDDTQPSRVIQKPVKKPPKSVLNCLVLGWSASNPESAEYYFRRALELDPDNPIAKDGLEWVTTETAAAQARMETAVDKAPLIPARIGVEKLEATITPASSETVSGEPATAKGKSTAVSKKYFALPTQATRSAVLSEERPHPWPRAILFQPLTFRRAIQIPFFRNLAIALTYLLSLTIAEAITVLVDARTGLVLHALILVALLIHSVLVQRGTFRRFLITLMLVPLIRLLSLSLPMESMGIPFIYRYVVVGFPILLASIFTARAVELTPDRINLSWRAWPWQILSGATGFGLGYIEYLILRPVPLVRILDWQDLVLISLIFIIFTGFLEEIIFRGLLQTTASQLFGKSGIVYSALLFGILHIGYYSFLDVLFAFSVGLIFGYVAMKTQSLLGVSLIHGVTNITLYVLFPFVLR